MMQVTVTSFEIVKVFVGGLLKGLTHTEVFEMVECRFKVGQVVSKPIGGSPYRIEAIKVVGSRVMELG